MHEREYNLLSLGAGVQSSCLLLMSHRGLLPRLDGAIFADTGWEPQAVYDGLEWLKSEVDTPIHIVSAGNLRGDITNKATSGGEKGCFAPLPLFVRNTDGGQGLMRRQCTREYKIEPIERFIKRTLLGVKKGCRVPKGVHVNQWNGISADELRRVRPSRNYWQTLVYPLVGLPKKMMEATYRRSDCLRWLAEHYPCREFPRSACIGCPFHGNAEWRAIRDNPEEWRDACEFDVAVRRQHQLDGEAYLHRSLVPLAEADIEEPLLPLFDQECLGYCGV